MLFCFLILWSLWTQTEFYKWNSLPTRHSLTEDSRSVVKASAEYWWWGRIEQWKLFGFCVLSIFQPVGGQYTLWGSVRDIMQGEVKYNRFLFLITNKIHWDKEIVGLSIGVTWSSDPNPRLFLILTLVYQNYIRARNWLTSTIHQRINPPISLTHSTTHLFTNRLTRPLTTHVPLVSMASATAKMSTWSSAEPTAKQVITGSPMMQIP